MKIIPCLTKAKIQWLQLKKLQNRIAKLKKGRLIKCLSLEKNSN